MLMGRAGDKAYGLVAQKKLILLVALSGDE
jgi:hypothetical protein